MDANGYYSNGEVKAKAHICSIIGLVCGILSIILLLCCCCIGGLLGSWGSIILGLAGVILSFIGNKKQKTGLGTAALICSIVGLVCGILGLIIGIVGSVFKLASGNYKDILRALDIDL